jgi:hypothetical protein
MKKVFLSILVFTAISSGVNAQSVFDKAAEDVANAICNCVNKTYKSVEEIAADETGEKGILFQECMESNTEKMKKKYENLELEPGFSDEMMFDLMLEKLAVKEKCALASMLMEMGRNAENTEETVEEEDDSEGE